MSSFDALVQVLRVLQQRRIPYMLVGAFSSNAYGYPRATKDADIVIQYYDAYSMKSANRWDQNLSLIHSWDSNY